jgi:hypothetical protein
MLEGLTMYSDTLMEKMLSEEPISDDEIHAVVKTAVHSHSITTMPPLTQTARKGGRDGRQTAGQADSTHIMRAHSPHSLEY